MVIGIAVPIVIALIAAIPFITIWALNTLFPVLAIPYNLYTWLAATWVQMLLFGLSNRN